jgi:NAD(P)-dependent dehydrogenase (short-subunit alcohol dehydrogenase family)
MRTVLITGCSSGYGLATARHFHARGWRVIATLRDPAQSSLLAANERMQVLPLDVTNDDSIATLMHAVGEIDVLVNNAGIGLFGAFEATPMATVREVFDTNTFGVMAMVQAFIPQFRARRSGRIINLTSSAVLAPMPLVAAYTASKTAIEGFTAALAHELGAFDVEVKLVEPGYAPTTRFTANGQQRMQGLVTEPYQAFAQAVFAQLGDAGSYTRETDVAEAVWQAAHDSSGQLHFPAGADAVALAAMQRAGKAAAAA